nr:PSME3-interacting protein-like [Lytechinus pictus]
MASSNVKTFVSEKELSEQRQRRQEEWDKVRTADQPEECPEEEYDPRSLFEKLQEQKDKKQSEYDEQFKFKNMIRGVDDGESKFLNEVAERQMKVQAQRMSEEKQIINEYKDLVVNSTVPVTSREASQSGERKVQTGNKRSQASLLAGAVKRKRPSSTDESKSPEGPAATSSKNNGSSQATGASSSDDSSSDQSSKDSPGEVQGVQCIAVLPGIGSYSNSSEDSDSDTSDSEGVELIKTVFHKGTSRHKCDSK